jgi:hypothetical protein
MSPAVYYYASHLTEGTELCKVKRGAVAAKVFDPRVLATTDIHYCEVLLQALFDNVKVSAFSRCLYIDLVNELPRVRVAVQVPGTERDFMAGAQAYDAAKGGAPVSSPTAWESDMKESARRIWAWWKPNFIASNFPAGTTAGRIVALIPMSGAFVEHVFSQAALVCEVGVDKMLQAVFELRVMVRANCSGTIPVTISGMS